LLSNTYFCAFGLGRTNKINGRMSFFRFLFSKSFFINTAAALLVVIALSWGVLQLLNVYTLHGEMVSVPDLRGYSAEEIEEIIEEKGLRFMVVDSVYDPKKKAGVILDQEPKPDLKVKLNRLLYLTVNSSAPPKVKMPNLVDFSLRQALAILESSGLKPGNLTYVPDIAHNAVLSQEFKGRKISPGEMIVKGSSIDLVLGLGLSDEMVQVPRLWGLTMDEAITALNAASLNLGSIVKDETVKDSVMAKVYRQMPAFGAQSYINMGSSVDIFITQSADKLNTPEEVE
jgi:eukaryotic-like serine/threonine-protein kinase